MGTIPWSWGAASCHRTVCELAWPCVPTWGHPKLPKGQKGLEQCLSLSAPRAGSQLPSLLAWLVHGSSAGVPMVRRNLHGCATLAAPLQGQELVTSAQHGVCCGDPLPCLSVLIPHPAGAVWAPWPGAVSGCQGLLVLAVPRVTQHFFPEPLGNRLAVFSLPSRSVLALLGTGGWPWEPGSPAGHGACLQHRRWQDGGAGSGELLHLGQLPHSTLLVRPQWEGPGGTSEPRVPVLLQQPGASGSVGLEAAGSIAPTAAPPGTAKAPWHGHASDGSPSGKQKGIKCSFKGRDIWSRCPPAAPMCPRAEPARVPGEQRLQRAGGWEAVNTQLVQ